MRNTNLNHLITISAKTGTKVLFIAWLPHSYGNEPYQQLWMQVFYIFIALEINILYRNVCILSIKKKKIYIYIYIYTVKVLMPASVIVIHYIG